MIAPGPARGAAPAQPTVSSGAALVPATGVTVPAQLGGTDNLPTMVAWPMPAAIGIAPMPPTPPTPIGATAGAVVPARSPPAAASPTDVPSRPPPAIPSRSEPAEAQFPAPMFKMFAPLLDRPKIPPSMFGLVPVPVL